MAYITWLAWQAGFSVADLMFFGFLAAVGVPEVGYLVQTNAKTLNYSVIVLDRFIFGTHVGSFSIRGDVFFLDQNRDFPWGSEQCPPTRLQSGGAP